MVSNSYFICVQLLTSAAQNDYLPTYDLLYVNTTGTLDRCMECTSVAIDLGIPGIPFGNYYHQTAYVSTEEKKASLIYLIFSSFFCLFFGFWRVKARDIIIIFVSYILYSSIRE